MAGRDVSAEPECESYGPLAPPEKRTTTVSSQKKESSDVVKQEEDETIAFCDEHAMMWGLTASHPCYVPRYFEKGYDTSVISSSDEEAPDEEYESDEHGNEDAVP